MATENKDFKVKNGLIVGNSTNLVNYTSASPFNPFQGQLWINEPFLYAWSGSAWTLIGDGNSGGGGGSASGTPFNIANTLVARSASSTFSISGIDFDVTSVAPLAVGRLQWSPTYGTPEIGLIGGNVTSQIGQHNHIYVRNEEGSPLVRGDVVYLFGALGDRVSVKKASSTTEISSAKTLGIVAEPIPTNEFGFITHFGIQDKLNLSDYSTGDMLWLSSSAGKFTSIEPIAPENSVLLGVVTRAIAGNGQMFVTISNGLELDELHNVRIVDVTDKDIIQYNYSASLWQNKSLLTSITEVDGAGSGIDSDLLDGQHGLYYQSAATASAIYLNKTNAAETYIKLTASATQNDVLVYSTSASLWINSTLLKDLEIAVIMGAY